LAENPPASSFLTARWVHLAMANYQVEPRVLQPLVPAGTELDSHAGRCFVSIVGFQFLDTRVLGVSIPFHRHFDEVNLRFYVRRRVDGEVRRGVVFIREIVPRRAIAWLANWLYNEKYVALPMAHDQGIGEERRRLTYRWRHDAAWCHLGVTLEGDSYLPELTSEDTFITEHYWGYTAQRDGATLEYQVEHPRWRVWKGSDAELVCDVAALYGAAFAPFLSGPPSSCFVADGSAVRVGRGVRLK
jgi:uncharacterized protein YqjF (DUF2071 family)